MNSRASNMKVCCINPPVQDFYTTSVRRQPLGLLYVIAAVRRAGFDVTLINGHSPKQRPLQLPPEFAYLLPYIGNRNPRLSFPYKGFRHYGMSMQEMEERIRRSDATVFFISSLFTPYHLTCAEIIAIVRKLKASATIAVGGYHAALYPEYFLKELGADFVFTGEGEESAPGLLRCIARGDELSRVPNLCYIRDGAMVTGRRSRCPVGDIPFPARDLLLRRDFTVYRKLAVSLITSRGCPNRCSFCTGRTIWGDRYIAREASDIYTEIMECIQRYNVTLFNFEDDNLFPSRERAGELASLFIKLQEDSGIRLDLTAMNGISLESMDEECLPLMKAAGFGEINISLMSISSEMQAAYRRPFDSKKFQSAALLARRLGMRVRAYFILGLPGQTREEVEESIAFLRSLEVGIFPSVYYNVNAPRHQWTMQRSSAFFNETGDLKRPDLIGYFNDCMAPRVGGPLE